MQGSGHLLLAPGDIVAVRTSGFAGGMIRFGAALLDKPNLDNHIAMLHHYVGDVPWGIEGRPGGVGWVDMTHYINSPYTISNKNQPKTQAQRDGVCAVIKGMLGTPYDWGAIEQDAARDLRLPELWEEKWDGVAPGHVVCSSLAVWGYAKEGLAHPGQEDLRHIQPADWTGWILVNHYE